YVAQLTVSYASQFNALVNGTDTRNWTDFNGNDIAEPNELGPSQNLNFGQVSAATLTADPDITREHNYLYNLTLQQELLPGLGLSVGYKQRSYRDVWYTNNLATTFADYTLLTTPDPRGNGESLPVYNLSATKVGQTNNFLTNSNNHSSFKGIDFFVHGRIH